MNLSRKGVGAQRNRSARMKRDESKPDRVLTSKAIDLKTVSDVAEPRWQPNGDKTASQPALLDR